MLFNSCVSIVAVNILHLFECSCLILFIFVLVGVDVMFVYGWVWGVCFSACGCLISVVSIFFVFNLFLVVNDFLFVVCVCLVVRVLCLCFGCLYVWSALNSCLCDVDFVFVC